MTFCMGRLNMKWKQADRVKDYKQLHFNQGVCLRTLQVSYYKMYGGFMIGRNSANNEAL